MYFSVMQITKKLPSSLLFCVCVEVPYYEITTYKLPSYFGDFKGIVCIFICTSHVEHTLGKKGSFSVQFSILRLNTVNQEQTYYQTLDGKLELCVQKEETQKRL